MTAYRCICKLPAFKLPTD